MTPGRSTHPSPGRLLAISHECLLSLPRAGVRFRRGDGPHLGGLSRSRQPSGSRPRSPPAPAVCAVSTARPRLLRAPPCARPSRPAPLGASSRRPAVCGHACGSVLGWLSRAPGCRADVRCPPWSCLALSRLSDLSACCAPAALPSAWHGPRPVAALRLCRRVFESDPGLYPFSSYLLGHVAVF